MTNHALEPGNGMCRLCLRDLFRFGYGETLYCDACRRLLRRRPDVDPATLKNGFTERLPQERPCRDPRWADGAACEGAPGELFDHRTLATDDIPLEIRQAAALFCAHCPILDRCRAEADEHEYEGLWGGQWRRYAASRSHDYVVRDLLAELDEVAS